jgi:hypothetical protein
VDCGFLAKELMVAMRALMVVRPYGVRRQSGASTALSGVVGVGELKKSFVRADVHLS